MALFLHKLLPIFVLPLGFSITLIAVALFFKKRWLAAVGVWILLISSMPIVGDSLLKILENRFPKLEVEDCAMADAIVVLSGMLHKSRSKRGGLEWAEGVDRFEQGVLLMKAGKAPLLIFTGGRIPWSNRKVTEGEDLRTAAIARGIPAEAIVVTDEVGSTADEAQAVRKLAGSRGLKRIILVTTAWHMPRAEFLFRRAGVPVAPFPVDYYTSYNESLTLLDFLPQAGAIGNTEIALRESYGLLYYKVMRR
ncbi:MAG TPA: YdcF family protein [Bryobacteraceae bacterium]|nr:YdcF family protein [Bryobacteraceae bacterium]